MTDLFDAAAMYEDDYLYFFASPGYLGASARHEPAPGAESPGAAATEMVWQLLDLRAGMSVLDLACGHGDMANRLASRGCRVTGLDSSPVFLDRARSDAAAAGITVEYVAGDMRQMSWNSYFDGVVNWSTAFGYFDDTTNRAVLDAIVRALRPGGRLAMDLDNLTTFLRSYRPSRVVVARDNGDMVVDRYRLDAMSGRLIAERTIVRDGSSRRLSFVKRLFGFPELRDWLLRAGFATVTAWGEDGQHLTADHERMIILAERA